MPRRSPRVPLLAAAVGALSVVLVVALASRGWLGDGPPPPRASGVAGWTAGPAAPAALTEVAAAAHQGDIWVAGGMDRGGAAVASVFVLLPDRGEWLRGPDLPQPVHHSALVSDGDALYLVGGYGADGRPTDRVLTLQGSGNNMSWVEHAPLPEPRGAGAAAWDGTGRVVYAGGVGPDGVSADVLVQDEHGWDVVGSLSEAREHLAATSDGAGTVYVLGGRRGGLESNLSTVDVVVDGQVRRLGDLPSRRGGVAAFWSPSFGACLVGGESPRGTNAQVECIRADGTVVGLPDLGRARHGLGAAVVDGRAWTLLGGERPGLFVSDAVEVLDLP